MILSMGRAGTDAGGIQIIAGERRGKKLRSVSGSATRPTSGRVREAIFNIISGYVSNAVVLDLYAGTGILGIEALSRGADFALFVDNSRASLEIIRKNIAACRFESRTDVLSLDIALGVEHVCPHNGLFNLVFADPPYNKGLVQKLLLTLYHSKILAPHALIVVEHARGEKPEINLSGFQLWDQRTYGKTMVSFIDYTI